MEARSEYPVSRMRTLSGVISRARRSSSTPSMPGMRWSLTTTGILKRLMKSSASMPLAAVKTWYLLRKMVLSAVRMRSSSSTNRTRCLDWLWVGSGTNTAELPGPMVSPAVRAMVRSLRAAFIAPEWETGWSVAASTGASGIAL